METSLRIENPWPNASVFVKERTESTMEDARALAELGCVSGTTVVAGSQSKGRGRVPGRLWVSPPWESLLATIVLRRVDVSFPPTELPLRAAVAVARAIEDASGIPIRVKRPNDLLFEGKKLSGILCEARGDALLIGIGVNCMQCAFPRDIESSACSILQACGREVRVFDLLALVLGRMREVLSDPSWRDQLVRRLEPGPSEADLRTDR
jgi:BirA family biotin operon repressor/biotin-[acetyl-CoA-carboxylase] ligase